MAVPVDIFIQDNSPMPAPIPGVVVAVVDQGTFAVYGTATTGSDGRAAFLLNGGPYEVRFFKLGVTFQNPQEILVQEPAVTTNKFDFSGTLLTLPSATDPRCCTCTGRFLNMGNKPIPGATVRIMSRAERGYQNPTVVDGNVISGEVIGLQTDNDGFVSVDLIRGAEYFITFSGNDEEVWSIKVPDRASVNLIDLIHPAPVSLTWDQTDAPGNAITLAVGAVLDIHFSLNFSDYEVREDKTSLFVTFTNSDDTVMAVGQDSRCITVEGIGPGVAQVTYQAKPNLAPYRIPDNTIVGPALAVTVTP